MKKLLLLSNYHWLCVLVLSGGFAIAFAFTSYNLFQIAKANIGFIRMFGLIAIEEGALIQTFQILVGSCFSLLFYFGFKMCESELLSRYRNWQNNS